MSADEKVVSTAHLKASFNNHDVVVVLWSDGNHTLMWKPSKSTTWNHQPLLSTSNPQE